MFGLAVIDVPPDADLTGVRRLMDSGQRDVGGTTANCASPVPEERQETVGAPQRHVDQFALPRPSPSPRHSRADLGVTSRRTGPDRTERDGRPRPPRTIRGMTVRGFRR